MSRTSAREALVGRTIAGRYVLRALIGGGGMGAVYRAEHAGGEVALKLIDAELAKKPETRARFAREVQAMSAIRSPHIARIFEVGTDDGRPWIAMDLLHGEDLGRRLRREHRVPVAEALAIVAGGTAKIVDFGVSKIERPGDRTMPLALTGRGTILGTPFYMSPEQAQARPELDARADIYGVGAILFECLTGRPPHTGETDEQVLVADLPARRAGRACVRCRDPGIRRGLHSSRARSRARASLSRGIGDARRPPWNGRNAATVVELDRASCTWRDVSRARHDPHRPSESFFSVVK